MFLQIARETMLLLINNIHDKIMQNRVIRFCHVQNNLFTSDCQYFHNEKTFVRTTEVKQRVLITKIVKISKIALYFLFWHCVSLKLYCSQPIRINKFFHV